MRILCAVLPLVLLVACSRQPVKPTGIYRLGTAEKTMVLQVRASGDYVLQIDGPDSMTDEIRGRWKEERDTPIDVSFEGIVWQGHEPAPGRGFWRVRFESDGGICLDGEALVCFTKDEAA